MTKTITAAFHDFKFLLFLKAKILKVFQLYYTVLHF